MTESHKNFVRFNIFLKTSEFNCLLNNFAEIFVAVFLFADVLNTLPADNICTVNSVFVRISRPHKAVCRHKNTTGDIVKLLLLILPCTAEIADKMRIFF